MADERANQPPLVGLGIAGLDHILNGGLAPNRLYLVEGHPGAGKTTLALQFLLEGVQRGEGCLFVTLSESEEELRTSAGSHGWTLQGINILEIIPSEESLKPDSRYTMYHPSEVELGETVKRVLTEAERSKPVRLVFDSLSELRLLAQNPVRYRRQILALKLFFSHQRCTVLILDDLTGIERDEHLHSIAHGVISLERQTHEYGTIRRRLQVHKLRGSEFREGYHDFLIRRGGLEVFPRLVAAEHRTSYAREAVKSGLEALDALMGGGLARGTSTLLVGPAGVGKSSVAAQYAVTMATDEPAIFYLFDESVTTFLERTAGLGMAVGPLRESGRLNVRQVDPAELSPGEFAHDVRRAVEQDNSRLVVIDSLNGYLSAMPSENFLMLHLHELLTYLGQQGVTTLLILTQHGIIGNRMQSPVDTTFLADSVMMLRYFEAAGEIRQAISVIKKRTGKHERTIRELRFDNGITVGEPLRDFHGIMTGSPHYAGKALGEAEQ